MRHLACFVSIVIAPRTKCRTRCWWCCRCMATWQRRLV